MGGKAHGGRRVEREEAHDIFMAIEAQIATQGSHIALCGSYRRKKGSCGDLDIVFSPGHDTAKFDAFCKANFGMQKNGKKIARTGLINGVQVEFYVATPENLGTQLQMWTGSMYHNIKLRRVAKAKGYSMSQYGFRHAVSKELVTCATEQEVYDFLDMTFVHPEKR